MLWPDSPSGTGAVRLRMLRSMGYLVASDGLNVCLGVLSWIVAAHRFPLAEVGAYAVVFSIAALLGNVSAMGLGIALTRHRYADDAAFPGLFKGALMMASILGLTLGWSGSIAILVLPGLGGASQVLDLPWMVLLVVAAALFNLIDAVAVAEDDAFAVTLRNAVANGLRLLLWLTVVHDGTGMLVSTSLAVGLSVLVAAARRRRALARAWRARLALPSWFLRYSIRNYLVTLTFNSPIYMVPIITGILFGPQAAGAVALAWTGAFLFSAVGDVAAAVLVAEASRLPDAVAAIYRRLTKVVAGSLACLVIMAIAASDLLPMVFGPRFDGNALVAFRLFAMAAVPYAVVATSVARLRVESMPRRQWSIVVLSGPLSCLGIILLAPFVGAASPGWAYLLANTLALWPAIALWRNPLAAESAVAPSTGESSESPTA